MSGERPAVYWDACPFIAWIMDEKRAPGEMDGVQACLDDVKAGRLLIVTSTITKVELLSCKAQSDQQSQRFDELLLRPEVTLVAVDQRIAQRAHDLRDHYARLGGKTLTTPDAIHLATALMYHVEQVHTFDNGKTGSGLGLLELNGDVAGEPLAIVKPGSYQLRLV
jgi:predicted nucleic acid-binding protein